MDKNLKIKYLKDLEREWRKIKREKCRVNRLLNKNLLLSDSKLIREYKKLEDKIERISTLKNQFERLTGEKIIFYKNNEIYKTYKSI